jgi:hypothetical protein
MVLIGYSGARGTLIYEKNLMSKISCQNEEDGFVRYCKKLSTFFKKFLGINSLN